MKQNEDLKVWHDWAGAEGALRWENAKTIDLYKNLKGKKFDFDKARVFFARTQEQYDAEKERLHMANAVICRVPGSRYAFGSIEGVILYSEFCQECERRITEECVPQEVYCYEFNEYESALSDKGDMKALLKVVHYWGMEAARKIKRYNDWPALDDLEAWVQEDTASAKA